MLSVAPLAQGPGYYLELANINYYILGGEPLPVWHGTAAKEFGLSGVAQREHVERLCAGYHHETEEALVQNAGTAKRNPGQDLTFSAPKSVSIAWAVADPALRKAIEIKQMDAVREALDFIEDKAGRARVGKDGQTVVKSPLLFALFEHGTSRALDPQLHTHALCINLTMHADGRVTAADTTQLYMWKMAAGAMYRAALARGMQELGLAVEQRRVGASVGFELKHIPKDIIEEFSKRRAEIEELLKLRSGGLDTASPKYAEMVAKETRRTKDTEKPRQQLLHEWQLTAAEFGIRGSYLEARREPIGVITPKMLAERKEAIYREAIEALSENHSHWNEATLTKAVAERAAGRISAREARDLVDSKMRGEELIHLGTLTTAKKNEQHRRYIDQNEERYTTPEILRLEREMLQHAERIVRGPDSGSHAKRIEAAISQRATIDPEQAEAVRWICSGPGVRLMTGIAGAGKTFTLQTCNEVWKREGRDVYGCAIAGAAAKRLEAGTGIASKTLDSLLWHLDKERISLNSRSVVVVDEAGMVGTKHMARLLEHVANAPGARLVLVGDAKQLQPITAGGPFKHLAEVYGETKLENIRRQEAVWARQAVRNFEKGHVQQAIESYVEQGHFHLTKTRPEAMAQLIDRWKQDGGISEPGRVLMLASLNSEVKDLNLRAQAERIKAGAVDPDKKLFANGVFFHEGDRLQFQKNSKELGVMNSDTATVLKVNSLLKRLTVQLDDSDREITVSLKRYAPANIRLGYASTTHKAQGASIPHVHVLMGGPLTDFHMGYVQASRSQISTHIFCDRQEAGEELRTLVNALRVERPKTLAQDVINQNPERVAERAHDRTQRPEPDRGPSLSR